MCGLKYKCAAEKRLIYIGKAHGLTFTYCYGEVRDENDYLTFGCHGNNRSLIYLFIRGKAINGLWIRYSDNAPAVYLNEAGSFIIRLNLK